jgi:hypothetical protein
MIHFPDAVGMVWIMNKQMENLHLSGKEELALWNHGSRHSPYKLGVAMARLSLHYGDQRGRLDCPRRGEGLMLRMRNM